MRSSILFFRMSAPFSVATAAAMTMTSLGGCRVERRELLSDTTATGDVATLPDPTPVKRVAFRVPNESEITDSVILASVRRGRAIMKHTRDSLPRHVGNMLTCNSCHQNEGTVKWGMPYVGVYARFPQYRSRSGSTNIIEDRINDCFKRSMDGSALVPESRDMRDIIAYMAFLSLGYPIGAEVDGQGTPPLQPLNADSTRGHALFKTRCIRCHGAKGEGTVVAPPLWGRDSYNIGAGMARVRTAAAFIRARMPQDSAGVLTPQEAFDLARYVNSQPRPDFKGKEKDWPRGDAPPDAAYDTEGSRRKRAGTR
ncbi:MAG: c-type cytochrome [Gemmatimonadaceae bacterium]